MKKELLDTLEQKAGRVIINGFPTGVEVCSSRVHGRPFPSTTDSKTTSVGTAAIYRFTRPVCHQNMPQPLLPAELKDKNVLSIYRLINGVYSKLPQGNTSRGRWGHRPRRVALVGVSTNQQQFRIHPINVESTNKDIN